MESLKNVRERLRKTLTDGARTLPANRLLLDIATLHSVLNTARTRGASKEYLHTLGEQGRDAILADLALNQSKERERLTIELDKVKANWQARYEKDYPVRDFRIRNLERHYQVMGEEELRREVQAYCTGNASGDDPAEVEALLYALKTNGLSDEAGMVRVVAQKNSYDRPWLREPEGALLNTQLQLNSSTGESILLQDEKGRSFSSNYAELYSILDPDEGADNE